MNKNGFVLLAAIFVMVFFALAGIIVASLLSSGGVLAQKDLNSIQAFHIAEAGINFYIATSLEGDSDWTNNSSVTKTFGKGSFTVSIAAQNQNRCTMESTGTVNGISRTIRATYQRTGGGGGGYPAAFSYAVYSGNQGGDELKIQNLAAIHGDFYYNGDDITMKNNAYQDGGVFYSVAPPDLEDNAHYESWQAITPLDMPSLDTSYYDALLAQTSPVQGSNWTLSGSSTYNLAGGTFFCRSATIQNSARLIGPGTIITTVGDFIAKNSAIIDPNIVIISKDDVFFQNSATIGANLKVYCYDDISIDNTAAIPADAEFFLYGDAEIENGGFTGVILAPNGEIEMDTNGDVNGLLYATDITLTGNTVFRGSVVIKGGVADFKNNAVVYYDPTKLPADVPEGFSGGTTGEAISTIEAWSEVY